MTDSITRDPNNAGFMGIISHPESALTVIRLPAGSTGDLSRRLP